MLTPGEKYTECIVIGMWLDHDGGLVCTVISARFDARYKAVPASNVMFHDISEPILIDFYIDIWSHCRNKKDNENTYQ